MNFQKDLKLYVILKLLINHSQCVQLRPCKLLVVLNCILLKEPVKVLFYMTALVQVLKKPLDFTTESCHPCKACTVLATTPPASISNDGFVQHKKQWCAGMGGKGGGT